jgi:hypothetical protein
MASSSFIDPTLAAVPRPSRRALIAGAAASALLFLGNFIEYERVAPPNAVVYINPEARTYLAPSCLGAERELLPKTTKEQARATGLKPDRACVDAGGFIEPARSLSRVLLERAGILAEQPSRWDRNGQWRW